MLFRDVGTSVPSHYCYSWTGINVVLFLVDANVGLSVGQSTTLVQVERSQELLDESP